MLFSSWPWPFPIPIQFAPKHSCPHPILKTPMSTHPIPLPASHLRFTLARCSLPIPNPVTNPHFPIPARHNAISNPNNPKAIVQSSILRVQYPEPQQPVPKARSQLPKFNCYFQIASVHFHVSDVRGPIPICNAICNISMEPLPYSLILITHRYTFTALYSNRQVPPTIGNAEDSISPLPCTISTYHS